MAKNNSTNTNININADGFDMAGGTTPRKITITGGDVALTGSGASVITFPSVTATLAGLATTDNLTNKTFSVATGTTPFAVASTTKVANLNADMVDGFHASATATASTLLPLDGSGHLPISTLNTGANAVSALGASTTTSTTYTSTLADAITTAITVTIGSNGLALISINNFSQNNGASATSMSVSLSGANTLASSDNTAFQVIGSAGAQGGYASLFTGLTAGSTTFTLQYRVYGGTGTYAARKLAVIPL